MTSDNLRGPHAARTQTEVGAVSAAERVDVWNSLACRIELLRAAECAMREHLGAESGTRQEPGPRDPQAGITWEAARAEIGARIAKVTDDIATLLEGVLTMDLATFGEHPHPVVRRLADAELMRRYRFVYGTGGATARRVPGDTVPRAS